jgi:hypothetical protein
MFLCIVAYSIMLLLGKFIDEKMPNIKKNLPIFSNLLLAFSSLPESILQTTMIKPKLH